MFPIRQQTFIQTSKNYNHIHCTNTWGEGFPDATNFIIKCLQLLSADIMILMFPWGKSTGRLTKLLRRLLITGKSHFSEKVQNCWNTPAQEWTSTISLEILHFPTLVAPKFLRLVAPCFWLGGGVLNLERKVKAFGPTLWSPLRASYSEFR